MPLVELLGRAGRAGGISALVLGVGLLVAGLYLTFGLLAGAIWPIMLGVCALGLVFVMLGVGVLFGSQARLAAALKRDAPSARRPRDRRTDAVLSLTPPFWVCSDCRLVESGLSTTRRCTECGHITGFVQVMHEDDRRTALACMS